jgi:hypothetical protein
VKSFGPVKNSSTPSSTFNGSTTGFVASMITLHSKYLIPLSCIVFSAEAPGTHKTIISPIMLAASKVPIDASPTWIRFVEPLGQLCRITSTSQYGISMLEEAI